MLPCKHQEPIIRQVQPTIDLLTDLDTLHPDILVQHAIQPSDYKSGLVFRSAIESIRGSFIASSTKGREGLVGDVLENLYQRDHIARYEHSSSRQRYDFTVVIERDPDYFTAIEVKGGEGNSINISERPIWAKEFAVWCHLDGAVVNQPAHGAHSIVNRLTNELVRRGKRVDALFFKDMLCGTRTRPCPKYPGCEETIGLKSSPDIFLFPQSIPTLDDPEPPIHTLDTLRLPKLVLNLFGIEPSEYSSHLWQVHIKLVELPDSRRRREIKVHHQESIVAESKSRSWQPEV
jgi:hypothetical protein